MDTLHKTTYKTILKYVVGWLSPSFLTGVLQYLATFFAASLRPIENGIKYFFSRYILTAAHCMCLDHLSCIAGQPQYDPKKEFKGKVHLSFIHLTWFQVISW